MLNYIKEPNPKFSQSPDQQPKFSQSPHQQPKFSQSPNQQPNQLTIASAYSNSQ